MSPAAARSQVGQDASSQRQVAAQVVGQRVQHGPVLLGRAKCAQTQQRCQVMDVSAEGRDFCAGRDEGRELVCAIRTAGQHWHACDQTRDEVAGRKLCGLGSRCDRAGLLGREAERQTDAPARRLPRRRRTERALVQINGPESFSQDTANKVRRCDATNTRLVEQRGSQAAQVNADSIS